MISSVNRKGRRSQREAAAQARKVSHSVYFTTSCCSWLEPQSEEKGDKSVILTHTCMRMGVRGENGFARV